jgi:hypothetical protein
MRLLFLLLLVGCQTSTWEGAPPPAPVTCQPGEVALLGGAPFSSFADALAAASPGAEIVLCPGEHADLQATLPAGPVSIRGATGVPGDVIVTYPDLSIRGRGALRLQGLTLVPDPEAALSAQAIQLADLAVAQPGLALYGEALQLARVTFRGQDPDADALYVNGESPSRPPSLVMTDVRFDGVVAGAALHTEEVPTLTLRRTAFVGVQASRIMVDVWGSLLMQDCTFQDNDALAVLSVTQGARTRIERARFTDNVVGLGTAFLHAAQTQLIDSVFYRNVVLDPLATSPDGRVSAALSHDGWLQLRNVDFGSGASENQPWDVAECLIPHLGIVTATWAPGACG